MNSFRPDSFASVLTHAASSSTLPPTNPSLQDKGITDGDFQILPGSKIDFPALGKDVLDGVDRYLSGPCIIEGVDRVKNVKSGYKTSSFTLLDMLRDLATQLHPLVEDIRIVGSAVPCLLDAYPKTVSGIKEQWSDINQAQFVGQPNDLDIRVYLSGANKGTLDIVL